jgi:hypothetical protein
MVLEQRIVRALARPRWFIVFSVLPTFAFAAAFLQTIEYSKALAHYNGVAQPEYFKCVFAPVFQSQSLPVLTTILLSWVVILHLVFGLSESHRRKRFLQFLHEDVLRKGWEEQKRLVVFLIVAALTGGLGALLRLFSENMRAWWLSAVVIIALWFLSKRRAWGTNLSAMGRSVVICATSSVVIGAVCTYHWILMSPTEVFGDLWKDLFILALIYDVMVTFLTWIGVRYSTVPRSPANVASLDVLLPILFCGVFLIAAILLWWMEANYADTARFAQRIAEHLGSRVDQIPNEIGHFRHFQNDHVLFRSLYCLVGGVCLSVTGASLLKVLSYRAVALSRVRRT